MEWEQLSLTIQRRGHEDAICQLLWYEKDLSQKSKGSVEQGLEEILKAWYGWGEKVYKGKLFNLI